MTPFEPDKQPPAFMDRLADTLTGIGQRIAVHLFAVIMGFFGGSTAHLPLSGMLGGASFGFSVYIGAICLIPRGIGRRAEWVIPTASGLLLMTLWAIWGVPWQYACIWGGAVTWTIRRILQKGQIDWEWAVLPWLIICLYGSFAYVLPQSPATAPLWLFPILVLGGWGALTIYAGHRGAAAQRSMLAEACNRLEKKLAARNMPENLDSAVIRLASNTRRYLSLNPRLGTDTAGFASAFGMAADRLATAGSVSPEAAQKYLQAIARLEEELAPRLAALERQQQPESLQNAVDKALAARIEQFRGSAMDLQKKSRTLPMKIRGHADGIAAATENLLACMRDDPQDAPLADRFLSRYLKAAHNLLDEYARLSPQAESNSGIAENLARSENLLERLQKAFAEEHARLLQNDTINFTAELNVLDKLLKMDGR